jgi:16S rRNA (cytidine1402-2'-O)-methyltransferase
MLAQVTGKLILCATPIGNLGDASDRLKAALAGADSIYAEDTRRAATLLQSLDVRTKPRSYFVGNEDQRSAELGRKLAGGETVALISDAGMPAIADPGLSAVQAAIEAGAEVTVVPGPSAVTAALAVSGLPAERFVFEGFLPRKGKERAERIAAVAAEQRTTVLFSAKKRVGKDLSDLAAALGLERSVVVTRELTKAYEEVWRGTLGAAADHWTSHEPRGEFTLVIGGGAPQPIALETAVAAAHDAIDSGESMADAVRRIAADTQISRRDLYEAVLRTKA